MVSRMIELAEKKYNCSQIMMILALEQEGRENHISHSHAVFICSTMSEPVRNIGECPEVVNEDHQQHGQCPENINGFKSV